MTEAWAAPPPDAGFYTKRCSVCGRRFFTTIARDRHERDHRLRDPGRAVLLRTGIAAAALNNSRRRRCDTCGRESSPAGIGNHQKSTGHTAWTDTTTGFAPH